MQGSHLCSSSCEKTTSKVAACWYRSWTFPPSTITFRTPICRDIQIANQRCLPLGSPVQWDSYIPAYQSGMNLYLLENSINASRGGPQSRFEVTGLVCRTRFVLRLAMMPALWLCPVFFSSANTRINAIQPTQMQARIEVSTDQPGRCVYRASRGTVFSSNIPDLLDNGNTD